jgi:acyl-CoA thioester hydrolase
MYVCETPLTVRYVETDRMGIVHHSVYAVWFEVGRTDFLKKLGFSYSQVESAGINMPLTDLTCQFCGTATYEDEIIIRSFIRKVTVARIEFGYEVMKKGQETPITYGTTTLGFTDRTLKAVNFKKKMPEIYELMLNAAAGEE